MLMPPRKGTEEHEQWLDEIVSLTEAAALRKVSPETLRKLIVKGRLKVVERSEHRRGMSRREALRNTLRDTE